MSKLDAFIEARQKTEYLAPTDLLAAIEAEERGGNGDRPFIAAQVCAKCEYQDDCPDSGGGIEAMMCPVVRRQLK
jgi:hypothetical protein